MTPVTRGHVYCALSRIGTARVSGPWARHPDWPDSDVPRYPTPTKAVDQRLMKRSGYPIVGSLAELSCDKLVKSLRVWLDPARFFSFFPRVEVGRVTHHEYPDAMVASDMAGFVDRQLDRLFLIVGHMEHQVCVRSASQMGKRFIDSSDVTRVLRLDFEGHDLHVFTGQVPVSSHCGADTTIVNVALPAIGRSFSVPPTTVDGISVGYLVSLALFMPASDWLGDRYGRKRVLIAATAAFTVASALCGTAAGLGELIAFRVLQSTGGGLLIPVGMAMLLRVPARLAAAGVRAAVRPGDGGPGGRPRPRRTAVQRAVLALGLLRERAGRHRGGRLRARLRPPRRTGPAGPVRPARLRAVQRGSRAAHDPFPG